MVRDDDGSSRSDDSSSGGDSDEFEVNITVYDALISIAYFMASLLAIWQVSRQ